MKEGPATAIVPLTETTAELIPQPTIELIEKSFAENTIRNCRHALQKFGAWLQRRPISDGFLAEYITHLHNEGKPQEKSLLWLPRSGSFSSTVMAESRLNSHYVHDTIGYPHGRLGSNGDSYRHRRGQHAPG